MSGRTIAPSLGTTLPWGGGQFRFLRSTAGPAQIFGLETAIPIVGVTLHFGGRSVTVPAGVDTGASSYVIVDRAVAEKLKMPRYVDQIEYSMIGGAKVKANLSELERIDIVGEPSCSFRNPPTFVLNIASPMKMGVLIGEEYLKSVGATISYREGGNARISCQSPGTSSLLIFTGLIFLGFLIFLMVKE